MGGYRDIGAAMGMTRRDVKEITTEVVTFIIWLLGPHRHVQRQQDTPTPPATQATLTRAHHQQHERNKSTCNKSHTDSTSCNTSLNSLAWLDLEDKKTETYDTSLKRGHSTNAMDYRSSRLRQTRYKLFVIVLASRLQRFLGDDGRVLLPDFSKAYDTMDWKYLLKILRKFGFPEAIVSIMQCLHTGIMIRFAVNGEVPDPVKFAQGPGKFAHWFHSSNIRDRDTWIVDHAGQVHRRHTTIGGPRGTSAQIQQTTPGSSWRIYHSFQETHTYSNSLGDFRGFECDMRSANSSSWTGTCTARNPSPSTRRHS
ncbi:unnamed protein product [Phytophthora fragariaefolia]|uniref:Unnamed protein product n=1 Tax=Phytophthora fragariaefolia TaxID=1490495 RepID=A0A9W6Y9U0_9STRA|nr:unnamed protein product [Phytophthora fragariaefolia]